MENGYALSAVQTQLKLEMPKERSYTKATLECWLRIGFPTFSWPVETYPWSGRSMHIARRIVVSNYIEPEDVLKAVWVQEQAKRGDPDCWRAKEAGMSYISALLRERSGNRWMQEMVELTAKLPTVMGYMDQEWGEDSRSQLARIRRDSMHIASDLKEEPEDLERPPEERPAP
jgi:hypothetical protein